MIIHTKTDELFANQRVEGFTNCVLFEGKNGSGKSTLFESIISNNGINRREDCLDLKLLGITSRDNDPSRTRNSWMSLQNIIDDTPEKINIMNILSKLFGRTVEVDRKPSDRLNPTIGYYKNDNTFVSFRKDGLGIYNALSLLRFVSFNSTHKSLFIEEISSGLSPRLVPSFLDSFFKIASKMEHQVFITTQDPFVVFYFLKDKFKIVEDRPEWFDSNPEYSVFNFSDGEILNTEKVSQTNFDTVLSDLMPSSFMGGENYMKFSALFTSKKSK